MTLDIIPTDWFREIADDVIRPAVDPSAVQRTPELLARFQRLDGMVKAHAIARGEHEAMTYLTLYVMWNESLWRAEHGSWDDYCWHLDKMPFGVGFSTIKHKMSEIRKLLAAGTSPATIVKVLGKVPTAVTNFVNVFVEGYGDNAFFSKQLTDEIPEQLTPDEFLQELAALGPVEAIARVDRLAKRPSIWVEDAVYNLREQKLLFRMVIQDDELGRADVDLVIHNVPEWAQDNLLWRLLGRKRYFAAKTGSARKRDNDGS